MSDLEKLIESNAKAIEVLTSDIQEMKRDRNTMYQLMQNLDNRQGQLANQQQQLIKILKKVSD